MNDKISDIRIFDILSVVKTRIKEGSVSSNKCRESSAFAYKTAGKTIYRQDGKPSVLSDPSHIVFLP